MNFRDKEKLTDALLKCPTVSNYTTRRDITEHLANEIDVDFEFLYRGAAFPHVMRLIHVAIEDIDGLARLAALIRIVHGFEGDSRHMQHIYDLCQQRLYIQYYFDGEMLFGEAYIDKRDQPNSDSDRKIQTKCIQKFIELCEREIGNEYPEHNIDIQLRYPHIKVNGCENGEEVDIVREICESVYKNEVWNV